ncbi:MAG TPA: response regulator transcription factor [Rhodocyclaceae bacterium]
MRILVIEDDAAVAAGLKEGLGRHGFAVDLLGSAGAVEPTLKLETFDLAIVDLGLPDMDGLDLVRRLRRAGERLPIVILTARDTLDDCVQGLDAGADDYMSKPFRLPELAARIRALVRRHHAVSSTQISHGPLQLDLATREASINGELLELRGREWSVLEALVLAAPKVVSKEKLLQSLSGWDGDLNANAVEVYVSRLRTKLSPAGVQISTVRGFGYRLNEPDASN